MPHQMKSAFITLLALLLFILPAQSLSGSLYPDKYDDDFQDAAKFLPLGTDWRLLKAQCYQESRLKPHAVSPVGAMGLCQFMPNTWADMQKRYGLVDPWLPEQSIRAAAIYMNQLYHGWSSPRPRKDRYMLALASYNAGFGNILKSQKRCGTPMLYDEIMKCLPEVTGHHSKETIDYVQLIIYRHYIALLFGS